VFPTAGREGVRENERVKEKGETPGRGRGRRRRQRSRVFNERKIVCKREIVRVKERGEGEAGRGMHMYIHTSSGTM